MKITIELLKKHNRIFFSPKTVSFHKDNRYSIIHDVSRDRMLLKINNNLTDVAYYEIDRNDYSLTYTNY